MAVWIDQFSRRMISEELETRMVAPMVIEALGQALSHRMVEPDQLLIHIDQGCQYRANDYRELLHEEKMTCSMNTKECYRDNAVVESFFPTRKLELNLDDDHEGLISPQQLQRDMPSGSMVTTNASGVIELSAT